MALVKAATGGVLAAPAAPVMVLSPTRTLATVPAGASSCKYSTEARASAPLAMSQLLVNVAMPVGLNWKEQSFGSATTTTFTVSCARVSAGLAVSASILNTGK